MAYDLEREQWFPRPLEEVFAFFADAGNLEAITPPWLGFEVLTPRPIAMRPGTLIDYRLRLRGVPLRWRTEISVWQPPHRFVDEQRRGPYREWVHEHTFTAVDGGTLVRDRVRYRVPGGWLVHELFVRRDVERIFDYRRERLASLLGAAAARARESTHATP
ncbi:MAG: Polyketide cyclase / dehydrase and lipid transport [Acidobacteria bacterium]|jgi:ligand-binding SRPBCC domain-containing protein|nr:Polyketide cyclase / dehydrase and lipid transport [Acidobacteriota bacterium]